MAEVKNRELFENVPVPRAMLKMSLPCIAGQLIILIYNLADTFYIGQTNNPNMVAGASLILPIFNMAIPIASLVASGGGSLVSRLLGERRLDEAKRVSSFCIAVSSLFAVCFSLGMFCFMRPLLGLLGADADTFEYARVYAMCVIVYGGVPTVLTNVLSAFTRSIGESKKAGFGVMLGGILNMILDPLFMFVILPPGNETFGAGIATCISNCVSAIYFIIILRKLGPDSVIGLSEIRHKPGKSSIKSIFALGVPAALTTLLFDVDYIIIDKLMSGYSNAALAAIGIVLKAERFPLNVGIGICQGMVPIVAYNYANLNYKRMRSLSRFALLMGLVSAVVSISLYELFAPQILAFFIKDAETIALGTRFLRARSIATILMFLSFYHTNLFTSYGRGGESFLLGAARWVAFNIPMLFLLNRFFGMFGIVWAQFCADVFTVVLSVIVHTRFINRNIKHKSETEIPV